MKVTCPECQKVFEIPRERLKRYDRKIAFPCPSCKKGHIKIELDSAEAEPRVAKTPKIMKKTVPLKPLEETKQPPSGMALKRMVLQRLEELPPMPQIVLRAREIKATRSLMPAVWSPCCKTTSPLLQKCCGSAIRPTTG